MLLLRGHAFQNVSRKKEDSSRSWWLWSPSPLWIQGTVQEKAVWWFQQISKAVIYPGCLDHWIPFFIKCSGCWVLAFWFCAVGRWSQRLPPNQVFMTLQCGDHCQILCHHLVQHLIFEVLKSCTSFTPKENEIASRARKDCRLKGPGGICRAILTQVAPLAEGCLDLQLFQPKVIHKLLTTMEAEFNHFSSFFHHSPLWVNIVEFLW